MESNVKIPIILLAISQLVFVTAYIVYYLYIGIEWGFGDRLLLLMISDGGYLLLILSSISILMGKKWGWWLTTIVYIKLLIAKGISLIAETVLVLSGVIFEDFSILLFFQEGFVMFIYCLVLFFLALPYVRGHFSVKWRGIRLAITVVVSGFILYLLHFILVLLSVSWTQAVI